MAKVSVLKTLNPYFQLKKKKTGSDELSVELVKEARQKGELNLSNKGLAHVPDKVWHIEVFDNNELQHLEMCFDAEGDKWWEPVPLEKLNLSSNSITNISKDIGNLTSLTHLNLSKNSLEILPNELGYLNKLTHLTLQHNRLISLPSDIFKLEQLVRLDLSHNRFEVIVGDISHLIGLTHLDLSSNCLTDLTPDIGFLSRLIELNVSNNCLTELAPDICALRALKRLDLSNNSITQLPHLGDLRKMEILCLNNNQLAELPQVQGCNGLREMYLSQNNIQTLHEDAFEAMAQLKLLDLEHNKIEAIPEQIQALRHLQHLNLNNNQIKILPCCVAALPHLRSIQVSDNPIENVRRDIICCGTQRIIKFLRHQSDGALSMVFPVAGDDPPEDYKFPDIYAMRSNQSLSLANQGLSKIPGSVFEEAKTADVIYVDLAKNRLSKLPDQLPLLKDKISELSLSCNILSSIPPEVGSFLQLKYLDVQKNALDRLPVELATLVNLRELNLSYNKFVDIPKCIYDMIGLEIFNISDNRLNSINVDLLRQLVRLTVVDLRNNNISVVPPQLGTITSIKTLELSGNSFRTPNQACLEKGTESLMAYLRDRIPK